ncbi:MAG: gliding motility-associated protein GldC [Bacteroidetes bacterium]|jgi:gliding motility-associated protein GldC|nr:gliding motility-associated protein GldC [Bacteroidota bacterium]
MKTSEIKFKVTVDENNLPHKIEWDAPDTGEKSECRSAMIALWDSNENNTLRIDLWTKDMTVDEMKKFYHQNIMTLTDTYVRATNDNISAEKVRELMRQIGKETGVLK